MSLPFVQGASPLRATEAEQVFPWDVLHASDRPRDLLHLIAGQSAIGMRPQIITPNGILSPADIMQDTSEAPHAASLLSAWNHVRVWRKLLGEPDRVRATEIFHVHTFSAGMAAVRAGMCPVYDLSVFIDQSGTASSHTDERSWLARSFRVAEQFILARAGAVVVHTSTMKAEAVRRGASEESVYVVPDVFDLACVPEPCRAASEDPHRLLVFDITVEQAPALFTAFSRVQQHFPGSEMWVIADASAASDLHLQARQCGVGDAVEVRPRSELQVLLSRADIVIVSGSKAGDFEANPDLLAAMAFGNVVLAADIAAHRNVCPDGEGVLWISASPSEDEIFRRILELLRNPHLRRQFAVAAREFVDRTRSQSAVARQYDDIYRAAARRRRERNMPPPASVPLQPAFGKL